jgi:hypothetical protein
MKKRKKFSAFIITTVFLCCCLILVAAVSCGPPQLSLGEIVISPDVVKDTNEPLNPKSNFDVHASQIYATISYTGAMGKDSWRFKWTNTTTGEDVLDNFQKFSEDQPESYFEGIVASNIFITDNSKIIPPGEYRVDFYFNEKLEKSETFTVSNPDINILEVALAKEIDEKGAPVDIANQFYPSETVFACVKLDYLIEGNSIKTVWSAKDNTQINEAIVDLTENYYESYYVWFSLPLPEMNPPVQHGEYNVKIYLNENMHNKYVFEVLEIEPVLFDQKNLYTNEELDFTVLIPDNWNYNEESTEEGLTVYLNPPNNEPAFFAFTEKPAEPIKPFEDTAAVEVEKIAAENRWELVGSNTRTYNLKIGLPTTEINYLYKDSSGNEYIVVYSFTEYEDKVFVYSVIVNNKEYGDIAGEVYYTMLDSLTIKQVEEDQ